MAATPGPWGINRTGNTIVSNHSHPVATVSDAFHRQLAGGGVGKDAEFITAANPAVVLELLAELEAKDKRIAELESIREAASQVFTEIGNELGCNPDNESIMMAIDDLKEREKRVVALAGGNAELWETMAARLEAAEAKLATPVRLPTTSGRLGVAYTRVIPEVIEAIRAAGFTVEGDE
ncbi:ead/Ea22-like family protein [Serratia marcescens]|nr:ead/Ea22-like family protein [Serratia marcescens]